MARIFISYAREDANVALRLYKDLTHLDHDPWIDSEDILPGANWKQTISEAIVSSKYFVALISTNSITKRGFVQKELRQGLAVLDEMPPHQIYVIPVRLEPVSPSHPELRELQWVDLFDSYEAGFNKLLSAIDGTTSREASVIRALANIRGNTSLLYPALERWVRFGSYESDPAVRNSTLRRIENSLTVLKTAGLVDYSFAMSDISTNSVNRVFLRSVDREALSVFFDQIGGGLGRPISSGHVRSGLERSSRRPAEESSHRERSLSRRPLIEMRSAASGGETALCGLNLKNAGEPFRLVATELISPVGASAEAERKGQISEDQKISVRLHDMPRELKEPVRLRLVFEDTHGVRGATVLVCDTEQNEHHWETVSQ